MFKRLIVSLLAILFIAFIFIAYEYRYQIEVIYDDFMIENEVVIETSREERPIIIASYRDKPPSMFVYSEGHFSGPLRLVLEEAANRIGYDVEWKQQTLSTSLMGLLDTCTDSTICTDIIPHIRSKTDKRISLYEYSPNLKNIKRSIYFALHENYTKKVNTLLDLAGLDVGFQKGNYFSKEFQEADYFNKTSYSSVEKMALAFNSQEIDVMVISSKRLIEKQLKSIGASDIKYANYTIDDTPGLYFMYSRRPAHKKIYEQLNIELDKMKSIEDENGCVIKKGVIDYIFDSFSHIPLEKCPEKTFEDGVSNDAEADDSDKSDGDLNGED